MLRLSQKAFIRNVAFAFATVLLGRLITSLRSTKKSGNWLYEKSYKVNISLI
jgi:hypothetical protein